MVNILPTLVNGALISSIYALLAIGFTLIFGVGGILNLTHGTMLLIASYSYLLLSKWTPLPIALLGGIIIAAVASFVVYRGLVQLTESDVIITAFVTLLLALIVQEIAILQFSSQSRTLMPLIEGSWQITGTRIRYIALVGFGVSWVAIGILWYYVNKTKNGRAILATSMSQKGANLVGINIRRVKYETWILAGALAGLGGIFFGFVQGINPSMWLDPLVLAFIIVLVGGVGSIKGSIVGAYIIGYLETITVSVAGPEFRGIFALIVVVGIMLYRPEGLFGREYVE